MAAKTKSTGNNIKGTNPPSASPSATDAGRVEALSRLQGGGGSKAVIPQPSAKPEGRRKAASTQKSAAKAAVRKPPLTGKTSRTPKQARSEDTKPAKPKKMSGLDAAATVLASAGKPMTTAEMMSQIEAQGLWKTNGATPKATIYAAIIREIAAKGKKARFKKTEPGMFAANR